MRKNGSRLISLRQYKATDLFLFAIILIIFDLLSRLATAWLADEVTLYVFSLTVPFVLLVMMRWGWVAIFYAIGDAVLLTALNNPTVWESYLAYILGSSAILLLLIPLRLIGKQKVAKKWYFTALFVLLGWLILNLVASFVQFLCGESFIGSLIGNMILGVHGYLSLAIGMALLLLLRRLDGMFEDQKHYLLRMDRERKELAHIDRYGEEPVEIDEETLSILRKRDEDLE